MLLLLIFIILAAIACKIFFGMALEAVGTVFGILIVLIILIFRRKRK